MDNERLLNDGQSEQTGYRPFKRSESDGRKKFFCWAHYFCLAIIILVSLAVGLLLGHFIWHKSSDCKCPISSTTPPPSPATPTPRQWHALPGETSQLSAANNVFLEAYKASVDYAVVHKVLDGPVFWPYNTTHIALVWDGTLSFKMAYSPSYIILKDVCHQLLTTYLLLHDSVDKPLNATTVTKVTNFLQKVKDARQSMSQVTALTSTQMSRQNNMSDDAINLMQSVLDAKPSPIIAKAELDSFTASQEADIKLNVQEATNSLLEAWVKVLNEWRPLFDKATWQKAKAFIPEAPMAREGMAYQFFMAALGTNGNRGDRVYPASSPVGELDLEVMKGVAGVFVTDLDLGGRFLNDPYTMTFDLLRNASLAEVKLMRDKHEIPIGEPSRFKRSCPFH